MEAGAGAAELRAFLGRLGLSELFDTFRAQDVDDSVFTLLQEQDLRDFGLTVGQRRRFLAALAELNDGRGGPQSRDDARPGLELRRLTVMFCDMIGFTELTSRLSPDAANELLQGYYRVIGREMDRFGGFVAQSQGDGIVTLFGYPETLGANAQRAIEASLALQRTFEAEPLLLSDGQRITVGARIGIASGPAIVGHADATRIADGLHMVGTVLNRAARLQGVAGPGGVVVDDPTRLQCSESFDYQRLPDAVLKGFDDPVPVSRVERRGAARRRAGLRSGPLVGRDRELARLTAAWNEARFHSPRFCVVTGEAGSGKTTLLTRLIDVAAEEGARVVVLSSSPLASNAPLRPVIDHLSEQVARPLRADPLGLEQLRDVLPEMDVQDLNAVARLLDLDAPAPAPAESGAGARQRLLSALAAWLAGEPGSLNLIVVEDAHWLDATTRDLLERCRKSTVDSVMLFVASSRDRDEKLWKDEAARVTVQLGPLSEKASEALVQERLGSHPIPETYRRLILERGDGNPLMLETLARSAAGWTDSGLLPEVQVPTTIYESIGARLDALGAAEATARMLAVFGEPVGEAQLASASGADRLRLRTDLDNLRKLGIVAESPPDGSAPVRFQHQLYRDVIYERLVGDDRRALHRAAFRAVAESVPNAAETRPEGLAWHALGAQDYAAAAPLALRAGERALARSSLIEAGHFLDQALAAIGRLPPGRETDTLRLRALTSLASVKRARLGIAADEVGDLGNRMLALARRLGDRRAESASLGGLYAYALVRADYREAARWADELAHAAEDSPDQTFRMVAIRAQGVVAFHTGHPAEGERKLLRALAMYDRETHLPLCHVHGYDHAAICGSFLAFTQWILGDPVAARETSDTAIRHAREIGHAHTLAQALAFRALLGAVMRDPDGLAAAGAEAMEVSTRYALPVMGVSGAFFRDLAGLAAGSLPAGDVQVSAIISRRQRFKEVNPYNYDPVSNALLAEIMVRAGALTVAEAMLAEANESQKRTNETWTSAELLRVHALLRDARGEKRDGAVARRAAYEAAMQGQAPAFALRAACDDAETEASSEAHGRIATALAAFRSRDDGWDLRRADRLLGG